MNTPQARSEAERWESYFADRAGLSFAGSRGRWLRVVVESTVSDPAGSPGGSAAGSSAGHADEDAVFERLCEALTVQESFFFRERSKLALLTDEVLPGYADLRRPLRLLSAGCAAGQEAYTLAMLLTGAGLAGRYDILGVDLSPEAIESARSATYGRWSLRGVDDQTIASHFEADGQGFRVARRFREHVRFRQHNLLEPLPAEVGSFDVIMCRNVLIYLTPDAVRRVAATLGGALAPGGWLILGVSDPILDDLPGLRRVATSHGVAYRRPGPESAPVPTPTPAVRRDGRVARRMAHARKPSPPDPGPMTSRASAATSRDGRTEVSELVEAAERALELARPGEAAALAREALGRSPRHPDAHRALIQALAEDGRPGEALLAADRAVAVLPADAGVRNLAAVVLLEQGRYGETVAMARQALYLDPGLAVAHLVLARAHEGLGDHGAANRARRNAQALIAPTVSR